MDSHNFYQLWTRIFMKKPEFRQFVKTLFPTLSGAELFKQLEGMLMMKYAKIIYNEDNSTFEYRIYDIPFWS